MNFRQQNSLTFPWLVEFCRKFPDLLGNFFFFFRGLFQIPWDFQVFYVSDNPALTILDWQISKSNDLFIGQYLWVMPSCTRTWWSTWSTSMCLMGWLREKGTILTPDLLEKGYIVKALRQACLSINWWGWSTGGGGGSKYSCCVVFFPDITNVITHVRAQDFIIKHE